MAKVLRCRDVGMDCDYEVRADDENEVLEMVSKHAVEVHGISEVPEPMLAQIRGLIREE